MMPSKPLALALACLIFASIFTTPWTNLMAYSGEPKARLSIDTPAASSLFTEDTISKAAPSSSTLKTSALDQPTKSQLIEQYGMLSMGFEANGGQTDPQVKFLSRGSGYNLFLTATEAVMVLHKGTPSTSKAKSLTATNSTPHHEADTSAILRMKFVGANQQPQVAGLDALPGKTNYFIGNDMRKWRRGVANYKKVVYKSIYPGIDATYYGNQRQLEYDFIISPDADPKAIAINFQGAQNLRVDSQGDLVLSMGEGEVRQRKPVAYQEVNGVRKNVDCQYVIEGGDKVRFAVGTYDGKNSLIIDPVISYATFLGGDGEDYAKGIAVDANGNVYVGGMTTSANFPGTSGTTHEAHDYDAFVIKLNPKGTALLYSTLIGGARADYASGFAVDAAGNAYLTGDTISDDFPTHNAFQPQHAVYDNAWAIPDAFVTKLSSDGATLVYSTYLGGSGYTPNYIYSAYDYGRGIAVDASGNAYVVGEASPTFPTVGGFSVPFDDSSSGFAAKFSPTGGLIYSSIVTAQRAISVAAAADGSAYVIDEMWRVLKINPQGTGIVFTKSINGAYAQGINTDADGNFYVSGAVTSPTDFVPTPGAYKQCCGNAQLTKFNSSGIVIYSTYIDDGVIALDAQTNVYIAGAGVVQKIDNTASTVVSSTPVSGVIFQALAVGSCNSEIYAIGQPDTDFSATPGAFQTASGGGTDTIIVKLNLGSKPVAADATNTGPYTPASAEYKLPAATDPDVMPDRATELWARVYWPSGFPGGARPLLVFLHGNHGTCGRSSNPRIDDNSDYTLTGICPPVSVLSFFTTATVSTLRNDVSGWVGMKITVGVNPITVRQLGRIVIAGNNGTHLVKIVRVSDNADIASVSVPMASGTPNSVEYAQLPTPATLAANTSYYIVSQETSGGDQWYGSANLTTNPIASIDGQASSTDSVNWNVGGAGGQAYGFVSFIYDVESYTVTPNHLGYDYLATRLASQGYVVVSINANRGMTGGISPAVEPPLDPGYFFSRARLVLKHLQRLKEWNATAGTTPGTLGIDLAGKLDFSNVGLMGHSRGGEGVRLAYKLYGTPTIDPEVSVPWQSRIPGLNIKAIFEIAPTDVPAADQMVNAEGVKWNVMLPMCDGDLTTLPGVKVFDRTLLSATGSTAKQKSTYTVWGANHNFFNAQWQLSDAAGCVGTDNLPLFLNPAPDGNGGYGSAQQRQIALASLIAFFRANVGSAAVDTLNQNFNPRYDLPDIVTAVTRVERGFAPQYTTGDAVITDFPEDEGKNYCSSFNACGATVTATNRRIPNHDPGLGTANITWGAASNSSYYRATATRSVRTTTDQILNFRISRRYDVTLNPPDATNFSIQLLDGSGNPTGSSVSLCKYLELKGPVGHATGTPSSDRLPILQTVRIPLADFAGADVRSIKGIMLIFNGTPTGNIYLTNVRLTN